MAVSVAVAVASVASAVAVGARWALPAAQPRAGRHHDTDGEGGYSPIEAVIVFPVLILLVMFVVQFALLWHGRNVAEAAAQNGLRSARGYASSAQAGQADAQGYLAQVAPNLLPQPTVTVQRTDTTVTVKVTAVVLSIIPVGLSVHESAAGPVERYVGPG